MQSHNLEGLRRQPLGAIYTMIIKSFWKIIRAFWPVLAVFALRGFQGKLNTDIYLYASIAMFVLAPVFGYLEYLFFKYGIVDNKFVIKKGIFKKEELSWPLDSIQGIHTKQNFLDKLLNLITVKLDATGTNQDKDELHINEKETILLREIILEKRAKEASSDSITNTDLSENLEQNIISELSSTELLKLSITANHLRMLGIMLAFFFSFFENTKEFLMDSFQGLKDETQAQFAASGILFVFYVATTLILIATIISFAATFIQYANFTIKSHTKGLAIEFGLISKVEKIIRLEKIQFISWKANFLRKKLQIYLLEFHSIGELDNEKLRTKLPITRASLLDQLIPYYGHAISKAQPFIRISKKYIFRTTLFEGILPALAIGLIAYYYKGWLALSFILLPIIVYLWHYKLQKNYKVFLNSDALQISKGVFGIHEIILNWKYVQSIRIKSSIYQRKHRLANLHLYTAGGTIVIPYLTLEDAQMIQDYALYKVESAEHLQWI